MTEKEKQYFDLLSKEYMSDESDSSDSESIVIHKLPWRSQSELDRFLLLQSSIYFLYCRIE